ncbi:uncharacterized protein [Amphiura filiformis]|uniref:uncharacterized protein n=1 Tax=Amphiura filiformis TaxID=82378 RepID=UPI003B220691
MFAVRKFLLVVTSLLSCLYNVKGQCTIRNLKSSGQTASSLTMSWSCFSSESDSEFRRNYRLTSKEQCDTGPFQTITDTSWTTLTIGSSDGSYVIYYWTINGLHPHSTYEMTLDARSSSSGSVYSRTLTASTDEAAPSVSPTNVQYISSQASSLTFTYNAIPCGSRYGNIQYQYEITDLSTNNVMIADDESIDESITNDVVTVTINSLQCRTGYRFRVRGANDDGQLLGPYTMAVDRSTSYVFMMLSGCADLSKYVSAGQTYQIVSYPNYPYQPTITNGIGPYVYTYNPPLNESYAVGTRQVTIAAFDTMSCAGGSCQITISIHEATGKFT